MAEIMQQYKDSISLVQISGETVTATGTLSNLYNGNTSDSVGFSVSENVGYAYVQILLNEAVTLTGVSFYILGTSVTEVQTRSLGGTWESKWTGSVSSSAKALRSIPIAAYCDGIRLKLRVYQAPGRPIYDYDLTLYEIYVSTTTPITLQGKTATQSLIGALVDDDYAPMKIWTPNGFVCVPLCESTSAHAYLPFAINTAAGKRYLHKPT